MRTPIPLEMAKNRSMAASARWLLVILLIAFGALSCAPKAAPIAESLYPAKLAGNWQGTVSDMKETVYFCADGGFPSQLRPPVLITPPACTRHLPVLQIVPSKRELGPAMDFSLTTRSSSPS
jgi:hypothetical protein